MVNRYGPWSLLAILLLSLGISGCHEHPSKPKTPASEVASFSIEKRQGVTTSRVLGSPDPPLPYTIKHAYPKLKLNFPVAARMMPGTDWLLFLSEAKSDAPMTLMRLQDRAEATSVESLHTFAGGMTFDLCFHPNFRQNGYVYFGSNTTKSNDKKLARITRYTIDPSLPHAFDPNSAQIILEWPSAGHDGVAVAFGPDGMLYVTSGDGTSDSDIDNAGQRLDLLRSKVLRIDVDHPADGKMYSVPKDNPFVGIEGIRPETWAYGLRNPWRMTIDQTNGNVWVGNNGQDLWEQVYLATPGANFGWSVYEGSHLFNPLRKLNRAPLTPPIFEHAHDEARSLTGGVIYHGDKIPELQGAYLYGDYTTGKIWAAKHDGQQLLWHKELADTPLSITGFVLDHEGEVMVLDHRGDGEGNFYHLVPNVAKSANTTFPAKLSETGLFRSVAKHDVEPTLIPYSVNSPQWSSGAVQRRYLAFPEVDIAIDATDDSGDKSRKLPNRTVLIKSLGFEQQPGNPKSIRWLETQLLTKQQHVWNAYTYAWNDEGTDATLVATEGMTKPIGVTTETGTQQLEWRFASRTECMNCHSRAAGHVIGLSPEQLNRDHNYGQVVDNQLRTWKHLGLREVNEKKQAKRKRPKTTDRLVDPRDTTASLDDRARSYLHANCSHCHVYGGGGNAKIDLSIHTELDQANLFGNQPIHATFDLPAARLITPGDPYRSVLYYRLATSGSGRMPPAGNHSIDKEAMRLIYDWISQMEPIENTADAEIQQALKIRQEEDPLQSKLITLNDPDLTEAIDKLLASGSGSLGLHGLIAHNQIPRKLQQQIITKAKTAPRLTARDLFDSFLPLDQRRQRLGSSVDVSAILAIEGDSERGKQLFHANKTLNCVQCHRLADGPERVGPDLTHISNRLNRKQLLESLLEPSKTMEEKYRTTLVVTNAGKLHSGRIVSTSADAVVLLDIENKRQTIARSDIEELSISPTSLMPASLTQNLTAQQLADLLAYLEAAK